jgi:beta-glucosidase
MASEPKTSGTYLLVAEAEQLFSFYLDDSLLLNVRSWNNPNRLQEAIDIAKQSDAVILCLGLNPTLEGEEMPVLVEGFAGGDRIDIGLPRTQKALIKELAALGKPTVLVLLNGSALALEDEAAGLPAIVEAWYPGQQGGAAIADVLFGDYNPAGRLPVTFYKNANDIPEFTNYDMQGKTYRYFTGTPLYEFGYGLSYSTFEYSIAKAPQGIKAGENIKITAEVTNTGQRDGDEVVQLYVSLPDSKLKKPVRALQGFKRIHLKAGEHRKVEFTLTPDQIAARDEANQPAVEAGTVHISVGGKQPDTQAIAAKQVAVADITVSDSKYYVEE